MSMAQKDDTEGKVTVQHTPKMKRTEAGAVPSGTHYEVKNFDKCDVTRNFDKGKLELCNLNNQHIGKITCEPGWRWSTHVKPIVKTDYCMESHTEYELSGVLHYQMQDGSEFETHPGDMVIIIVVTSSQVYIPPGHDCWVVGDQTVVSLDFTGMGSYAAPTK